MIRFRYHPLVNDFKAVAEGEHFVRAVVVDEVVGEIFDRADGVRIAGETQTGLPAGLYWFTGLLEPIILQVGVGPSGTSSTLELDYWDDDVDHPLAEALHWADHL